MIPLLSLVDGKLLHHYHHHQWRLSVEAVSLVLGHPDGTLEERTSWATLQDVTIWNPLGPIGEARLNDSVSSFFRVSKLGGLGAPVTSGLGISGAF